MKFTTLLSALLLMSACGGGGDGPSWAQDPDADAPTTPVTDEDADPVPTTPRAPRAPRDDGSGTPDPTPSDPPATPSRPSTAADLAVENVWGEGLELEIDGLRWVGEGEFQFRVGLVDAETRAPLRQVDARDFQFAEDGVALGPEAWFEVERAKDLRVVLVLDTSYSIREAGALEPLRNAARRLVETLPREAQVAVVGFSTEYTLLADFGDDPLDVFAAIERMQPADGRAGRFTNLWGAVRFAAEHLGDMPSDDGGRAVVVFTDGRDNVAEAELSGALAALDKAGTATYAVGLGEDVDYEGLTRLAGDARVSSAANPSTLEAVFEAIASRIGEKLTVTYMTPKQTGTHTLDVTITRGEDAAGFTARFKLD